MEAVVLVPHEEETLREIYATLIWASGALSAVLPAQSGEMLQQAARLREVLKRGAGV